MFTYNGKRYLSGSYLIILLIKKQENGLNKKNSSALLVFKSCLSLDRSLHTIGSTLYESSCVIKTKFDINNYNNSYFYAILLIIIFWNIYLCLLMYWRKSVIFLWYIYVILTYDRKLDQLDFSNWATLSHRTGIIITIFNTFVININRVIQF